MILITDACEYLFGFDWQRVQSVIYIYLCPTSLVWALLLHQLMLIGQDILTNSNPNCCYWAHHRLIITPAEVRCQNYCINNWSPWLPSYCWTHQRVIFFKIFILPHITFIYCMYHDYHYNSSHQHLTLAFYVISITATIACTWQSNSPPIKPAIYPRCDVALIWNIRLLRIQYYNSGVHWQSQIDLPSAFPHSHYKSCADELILFPPGTRVLQLLLHFCTLICTFLDVPNTAFTI